MVSENMEPVAVIVDKLKGFAKSTQNFTNGILDNFALYRRRHPIEILKRLQREAFSDIMKLRDRQDKLERLLSLKSSKINPFQESTTRVKGEIQILGLLLMIDRIHEHNQEAITRTETKTGINSKFTFETTIRENDSLTTEFIASNNKNKFDDLVTPLSLAKVVYAANINNSCSLTVVPLGGKCSDVGITGHSFNGPPIINQQIGSGINLTLKKSNIIASLAQFVSSSGGSGSTHCLSTFGQIGYRVSYNTKLFLMGLQKVPKFSTDVSLGPMALPIGIFRNNKSITESVDGSFVGSTTTTLVVESDLDESTRIGGWVEMKNSGSRDLKCGLLVSDLPDDDFGWGLRVGGSRNWDHYEVEAFSNVKFGEKFSVQPSVVYVIDGSTQFPGLMMKSTWSF